MGVINLVHATWGGQFVPVGRITPGELVDARRLDVSRFTVAMGAGGPMSLSGVARGGFGAGRFLAPRPKIY